MSHWKKRALWAAAALLFVFVAALALGPGIMERRLNRVAPGQPQSISASTAELHRRLFIADLHADSLLWNRDLLAHSDRGHVDLPRLREGHVALQAFTIVTKTPSNMNIESNEATTDQIRWLVMAQRWPLATWSSLKERALYQARKLESFASRSGGALVVIRTLADVDAFLARRQRNPTLVAGFLGIEGAHALDGDVANVDALFDAGFRMMAPTHFFDNDIAGSAHGARKRGLTEEGREMIRRMEARGMLVDLAHASPQTLDDVLAMATKPVVVSHTGVKGTCDNRRNLSDEHLRGIARTGGVIGIGYWETAVCGTDARAIARAMRYAVNLVGVEHVALGSDFDGAVTTPFDTAGLAQITAALLAEGFSESDIRLLMGENTLRLLRQILPK